MAESVVRMRVVLANPKARKALLSLANNLESLAEDFEYREDVRKAVKAARYLYRNLEINVSR